MPADHGWFGVPATVLESCRQTPAGEAWLEQLPDSIQELQRRWSLTPDEVYFTDEATASWVGAVRRADGSPAVLKLGLPHMEAEQESLGLQFWDGDGAIRLFEVDESMNAMLLERCIPGTHLSGRPELEQDAVIATLLKRLWRRAAPPYVFRSLSAMLSHWSSETLKQKPCWPDEGVVRQGLALFQDLCAEAPEEVVLVTDLHAGNVLSAQREPWLVIDPKPFVGDPAYDATQHLFNCLPRVHADPMGTIRRFADLLELEAERVRLWMFARSAAEPREDWESCRRWPLARSLAG